MAKRRGSKRYKNTLGYRFTNNKYNELQRAVTNFNRRVRNRRKRISPLLWESLPAEVSFRGLRDVVASTQDVNEMIFRLNMYRREGFDFVPNPAGAGYITQAQLDIAKRETARENRRRARAMRMATRGAEAEGRLPSDQTAGLRPVEESLYLEDNTDPIAAMMQGRRIDERTAAWQERYIQMIEIIKHNLPFRGFSRETVEIATQKIDHIIAMVRSISPSQYYYAQLVFPTLSISITSNEEEFLQGLDEIEQTWESFLAQI